MKELLYRLATDQINTLPAKLAKGLLLVLSFVYGLGVRLMLFGYKKGFLEKRCLPKPVISVGNITLGGVGKTPLVRLIVEFLKTEGLRPAILTRGYMVQKTASASGQTHDSDEAALLRRMFPDVPVLVGRDRFSVAQKALEQLPIDVFVMDDGFQHWRLDRDLDIVAVDVMNPFGNGRLIPRGILREPMSSLSRADIFIITKADWGQDNVGAISAQLSKRQPQAIIAQSIHQLTRLRSVFDEHSGQDLTFLRGKTICSFCSIGNPESFARSLAQLGATVKRNFPFIDHHLYHRRELERIVDFCGANGIDTIVTTQKDAVKLTDFLSVFDKKIKLLSLDVSLAITKGQDEVFRRLSRVSRR